MTWSSPLPFSVEGFGVGVLGSGAGPGVACAGPGEAGHNRGVGSGLVRQVVGHVHRCACTHASAFQRFGLRLVGHPHPHRCACRIVQASRQFYRRLRPLTRPAGPPPPTQARARTSFVNEGVAVGV